jgi:hypothetical protein
MLLRANILDLMWLSQAHKLTLFFRSKQTTMDEFHFVISAVENVGIHSVERQTLV